MKDQLQKELKEKVKFGIKPSDLKKLKRSKSVGDIPKAPPLPNSTALNRSKSAQELEPTNSKIEQLESKISTLELKLEVSQREIGELKAEKQAALTQKSLFAEQLKEKQKDLESLRQQLETRNSTQELDQSLTKRHQNLKD
jgi:predicted RNase H-like nuclease (RuvC/YqgF family)